MEEHTVSVQSVLSRAAGSAADSASMVLFGILTAAKGKAQAVVCDTVGTAK
jgi:hypothetical protein